MLHDSSSTKNTIYIPDMTVLLIPAPSFLLFPTPVCLTPCSDGFQSGSTCAGAIGCVEEQRSAHPQSVIRSFASTSSQKYLYSPPHHHISSSSTSPPPLLRSSPRQEDVCAPPPSPCH
eukprot:759407-Hanusia_phi.AAC.8